MSANMPFDEIVLGEELGPWTIEVTPQVVAQYCADWDDHNPLYTQGTADGGPPIVPPAFYAGLLSFRLLARKYKPASTVGVRSEHRNLRPMRVGGVLRAEGRILEKYLKRGLEYVVVEYTAYDDDGEAIRESCDHILLGLERRTEADFAVTLNDVTAG